MGIYGGVTSTQLGFLRCHQGGHGRRSLSWPCSPALLAPPSPSYFPDIKCSTFQHSPCPTEVMIHPQLQEL